MDQINLGKQIQKYRKEQNMSADSFANSVGISINFVRDIESGRKVPSLPVFCKIVNVLRVSSDQLLSFSVDTGRVYILNEMFEQMEVMSHDNFELVSTVITAMIDKLSASKE